ncbi:MAG: hypothetical protein HYY93_04660 [Planctomycetes bacterium]|nr:hypothetical protein [Planctomycetota bacterium]
MEDGVFPSKKLIEASKMFVNVHAKSGEDDEAIVSGARQKWGQGVKGIPSIRFAGPDGTLLDDRFTGFTDSGKMADTMAAIAKKTGGTMSLPDYLKAKATFDDACAKLEAGETKKAIAALKPMAGMKTKGAFADTVKAKLEEIGKAGSAKLEEGRAAEAAKDWKAAQTAYKAVADGYSGLSVADEAKKALSALMANPEAKEALSGK